MSKIKAQLISYFQGLPQGAILSRTEVEQALGVSTRSMGRIVAAQDELGQEGILVVTTTTFIKVGTRTALEDALNRATTFNADFTKGAPMKKSFRSVEEYFNKKPVGHHVTIDDLAEELGTSRRTIARIMSDRAGLEDQGVVPILKPSLLKLGPSQKGGRSGLESNPCPSQDNTESEFSTVQKESWYSRRAFPVEIDPDLKWYRMEFNQDAFEAALAWHWPALKEVNGNIEVAKAYCQDRIPVSLIDSYQPLVRIYAAVLISLIEKKRQILRKEGVTR